MLPIPRLEAAMRACDPTRSSRTSRCRSANSSTPEQTFRYTLTNCQGMQIQLLTYGAITQSITVPDRHGHLKNIALGFATLADYVNLDSPPPEQAVLAVKGHPHISNVTVVKLERA